MIKTEKITLELNQKEREYNNLKNKTDREIENNNRKFEELKVQYDAVLPKYQEVKEQADEFKQRLVSIESESTKMKLDNEKD